MKMFEFLKSGSIREYAVVLVVNLSAFTSGMNFAWPSPMLVKLGNDTQTILPRPITVEEGSWIVSVEFIGAIIYLTLKLSEKQSIPHMSISRWLHGHAPRRLLMLFCLEPDNSIVAVLCDYIGRRYCVLLGVVPKTIAALLYIFATDVWMIIFGRALQGLADSFVFVAIPVYLTEISSKEKRGASCTYLQIFSSLGIVLTLSAGPFLPYLLFNIIYAIIIAVTSIPLLFLPESPFFLLNKGRENDALKVLTFLRASELLAKKDIKDCTISTSDEKLNKMAVLKNATVRKALAISVTFCFGAQLVGFNAVSYYLQTILISTGTSLMPEIASVVIGLIQLFSSLCTMFMTDKFGRKIIMITTLIGMCIGLIGLGVFFKVKPIDGAPINGFLNYLPLISLIVIVFCFNAGAGTLIWVIIAELFDGPARAFGVSSSISVNTTMIFFTTKYFPLLLETAGPAITYWFFSGVSALMCVFVTICVPETKGKTFVEIQSELKGKKNEIHYTDSTIS